MNTTVSFDMDTMGTMAYPLSTPLTTLWPNEVYNQKELEKTDAHRLTQMVVDYLQRESIGAYLVNLPCVLIAGEPEVVRSRKLIPAYMTSDYDDELRETLGFDAGRTIKQHADDGLSVGIMLVGRSSIANPIDADENYIQRQGIIMRYLTSKTSVAEVLRLAELTHKELDSEVS